MVQERSLGVIPWGNKLECIKISPPKSYLTQKNGLYPNYMAITRWKPKHKNTAELKRPVHLNWQSQERALGQIPCDIIYMWNLKYDTNKFIYETETDSQT